MTTLSPSSLPASHPIPHDAPGAARTALKMLRRLSHGTLTVQLPGG